MPHLDQLIEWLKQREETEVIDLLALNSEDIVERFMDRIEERQEYIEGQYEELNSPDYEYNISSDEADYWGDYDPDDQDFEVD